jgi:cytochrome c-type biogenesis protein
MTLLVVSFLAGILTILAPCILPLIPVIVGSSVADNSKKLTRIFVILGSLAVSIIIFTLILKASTSLLGVPQIVWQLISGGIVTILGLSFLFPNIWDILALKTNSSLVSQKMFAKANSKDGFLGAIVTGAALGPVFTSCSPTYLYIVAAILPATFWLGFVYLLSYVAGLLLVLFAVALLGRKLVKKLGWALDPHGWFKRSVGILMVVVGIAVIVGADKGFQAFVLESGLYGPIEALEANFRK